MEQIRLERKSAAYFGKNSILDRCWNFQGLIPTRQAKKGTKIFGVAIQGKWGITLFGVKCTCFLYIYNFLPLRTTLHI